MRLKDAEFKQKFLLKDKYLYYNGKLSYEEVERKGWKHDPFDGLKILKGEMEYYYNSDPEIVESEAKIAYLNTMIEALKDILDHVKWRHQTIRNMIEVRKFEAGF